MNVLVVNSPLYAELSDGASESLEATNVVSTLLLGVTVRVVFEASLHVLEHAGALRLSNAERLAGEIGRKEITEGRDLSSSGTADDSLGPGVGSRRAVESGIVEHESLEIGMGKVGRGHGVSTLERMTNDVVGMSVIADPLESTEPRAGLSESLSNLLRLIGRSVELDTHFSCLLIIIKNRLP